VALTPKNNGATFDSFKLRRMFAQPHAEDASAQAKCLQASGFFL